MVLCYSCRGPSTVTLSPSTVTLSEAKGLSRSAARGLSPLSMTGLDLSVDEELSSSFEPCLMTIIAPKEQQMIDQPQLPHFGTLLAEGKTKLIYAHPEDESLAYMVNKDQITAGDGVRRNELVGKSRWSTITTANVFRLLNDAYIATHFVEQINDVTLLVRRCTMLPIEQVQRRIATGSYLK